MQVRAKLIVPAPGGFIADGHHPALEEWPFDVTKAELKAKVPAHGAADNPSRKAMTADKVFFAVFLAQSNATTPAT